MSTDHENDSGKYFNNDKGVFGNAHPDAYDDKKISQLITATISILNHE